VRSKQIIIWTEGGGQIGMGHLARCSAIAQEARKVGFPVLFFVNDDRNAVQWIRDRGFEWRVLDLHAAHGNAGEAKDTIVVIDTKKPVERLVESLKQNGCTVALIDNSTVARLQADAVIYPTATFVNDPWWDDYHGRLCHGAAYIPLGEAYIEARKRHAAPRLSSPYHVLVTMGGSDPNRLTKRVISALVGFREDMRLTIVIGPAFQPDEQLEAAERRGQVAARFMRNVHDLSPLLSEAHIVVTAVGTTIYEAAFMGVPSVLISNYRSDAEDVAQIERLGISLGLGYFEDVDDARLQSAVASLLDDRVRYRGMSDRGRALIDGQGASRIVAVIQSLVAERN
jgi:spore coat polysaccharide biosynthesis predicted glycosyltransferase SpsG